MGIRERCGCFIRWFSLYNSDQFEVTFLDQSVQIFDIHSAKSYKIVENFS